LFALGKMEARSQARDLCPRQRPARADTDPVRKQAQGKREDSQEHVGPQAERKGRSFHEDARRAIGSWKDLRTGPRFTSPRLQMV
jgi:hypothetical protein